MAHKHCRILPFAFLVVIAILATGCVKAKFNLFPDYSEPYQEVRLYGEGEQKVLIIPIEGVIGSTDQTGFIGPTKPSMLEEVAAQLKKASKDKSIKAIVLRVNSPGGGVTASDTIYNELMNFKQETGVKIVSAMSDVGASGAYYISMAADKLIVHPTTITGSIGVIFVTVNAEKLTRKIGVNIKPIKSGRHKDMGSPFREMTEEEKALFQEMIDQMYGRFVSVIVQGRKMDEAKVRKLADGRIYTARQAVDNGLADRIGYYYDAIDEAKSLAGISADSRVIIYRRTPVAEDTIYNSRTSRAPVAAPKSGQSDVDTLLRSVLPRTGFYYIWEPALLDQ